LSIEIIQVRPNIAFRIGENKDYIIKNGLNVVNEIEIAQGNIDIRPLFLKRGEFSIGKNINEIENVFDRNLGCNYLVDKILLNDEETEVSNKMDWNNFSLLSGENKVDILTHNGNKIESIIKSTESPYVTVIRGAKYFNTGYFYEDY
jgi:hypothetical protein